MNSIFLGATLFNLDSDKTISSVSDTLKSLNDTMGNIVNTLTQDPSGMPELWKVVNQAISISQSIALVLVVLYWLTHFVFAMSEMDWRNISIWWYCREIIKLILAQALIELAPNICLSILEFGAWCIQKYLAVGLASGDIFSNLDYSALKTSLDNMSFMEHSYFRLDLLLPKFIMMICNLIIQVISYGRLLQICLMSILSSIPLATVAGGNRQTALRFIREYCSVVFQSALIILAIIIYKGIVVNLIGTQVVSFNGVMKLCMSTVVLAVTVFSSQRLAKMLL